jgi:hypothetical protein
VRVEVRASSALPLTAPSSSMRPLCCVCSKSLRSARNTNFSSPVVLSRIILTFAGALLPAAHMLSYAPMLICNLSSVNVATPSVSSAVKSLMSQFSATTSLAGRRNAMMIVRLPTGSMSTQRNAQNVGPPLRKTVGVITWCVQHVDVSIAGYAWDHGPLMVLAGTTVTDTMRRSQKTPETFRHNHEQLLTDISSTAIAI